eukprot:TRINITY_DN7281_c0_g1_i1.p1 TRINITY_DN7281_c0_g1~~TRINITY_DN7281_c0_g1_i1.p1  ORF type:complete len:220 (-),score=47.96 TRINITY_DN7281_c0_g1_i1:995-1654(-)
MLFASRLRAAAATLGASKARRILGVDEGASVADVKSAFRKQALRWHPDRNASAEAQARFAECRAAFEALQNHAPHSHGRGSSRAASASYQEQEGWQSNTYWWQGFGDYGEEDYEPPPRQTAEQKEAAKRAKRKEMRAKAQADSLKNMEAAKSLGVKRGVLLAASSQMQGAYTNSVVLVLEVDKMFVDSSAVPVQLRVVLKRTARPFPSLFLCFNWMHGR